MQFIIFVIDDQNEFADAGEMQAIDSFNDSLKADGHWVTAAGIDHGTAATLIDNRDGANQIEVGSLQKGQEHYSGFWLIEAHDAHAARELAVRASKACNRKVELRPYLSV